MLLFLVRKNWKSTSNSDPLCLPLFSSTCPLQLMFLRNRGLVQLTVELLDSEDDNSDEPMDAGVRVPP